MNIQNLTLKETLTGDTAFYHQKSYVDVTQREMAAKTPPDKASYTYETQSWLLRTFKVIVSTLIFPIGLYQLTHSLAGKLALLPASSPRLLGRCENYAKDLREKLPLDSAWKFKRISVKVDGYTIDATIMGRASTFKNGRWILPSLGNGEFYEEKLYDHSFKNILTELRGNALVFNYPGVGASSGLPNRFAMAKAYRAMLHLLEDSEEGLAAKEIIGYGHSIGGGVQGEALNSHTLIPSIKYLFIKSRTFSDISSVATQTSGRFFGWMVELLGWNMDSTESSLNLEAPEIILQSADVQKYTDISDQPEKIKHDGVIPAETTLGKKLLEKNKGSKVNKYFMGIPEGHNHDLDRPHLLVNKINEMIYFA